MKICFSWESIVPFNKGAHGDISQVSGMLKGLADRGHDVHFVCLHPGEIKGLGKVCIHQVPNFNSKVSKGQKLIQYIVKLHRAIDFEIFHFRSQNLVLLAKKYFPNKACFYTMMPFYFISGNKEDFEREQKVINACDKVVVFTEHWRKYYLKNYTVNPDKLILIRVGVDDTIFKGQFDKNVTPSKSIIGYFGGIREDYGLEPILNAMSVLKQEKSNHWNLMIAGTGNKSYLDELKKLIQHLKLTDDVNFLGYIPRDEVNKYLSQCSLAVNLRMDNSPGKNKGFDYSIPIKVVEYMLAGIPVVSSNDGGMKELLEDDYPFLVNPNNTGEIISVIKKVTFDKDLNKKIVAENKQKAAKFLNSNVINDFVSAYQSLLNVQNG